MKDLFWKVWWKDMEFFDGKTGKNTQECSKGGNFMEEGRSNTQTVRQSEGNGLKAITKVLVSLLIIHHGKVTHKFHENLFQRQTPYYNDGSSKISLFFLFLWLFGFLLWRIFHILLLLYVCTFFLLCLIWRFCLFAFTLHLCIRVSISFWLFTSHLLLSCVHDEWFDDSLFGDMG